MIRSLTLYKVISNYNFQVMDFSVHRLNFKVRIFSTLGIGIKSILKTNMNILKYKFSHFSVALKKMFGVKSMYH